MLIIYMTLVKSLSDSENLCNYLESSDRNLDKFTSFNDFEKLQLLGQQQLLTFGEYTQKDNSDKNNRRKIISYFYRNIKSKL